MARIEFIDQTLRDGQQSLWGMRLRAGQILPVADAIDNAGYRVVDLTGSSIFEVLVRFRQEDPWKGLDLIRAAFKRSTLRAGTRTNGVVGMGITPDSVIELWVQTLAKHGIGSLWIFDCLHDVDQMLHVARLARKAGLAPSPQINFSESPVHTDEYYAGIAEQMVAGGAAETIVLGDEAGVLGPERARRWIRLIHARAGDVPLEMHFHNKTAMANLNHIIGVEEGLGIVHTAVSTMANGVSMPSTEVTADNMRRLGHEVTIDDSRLAEVAEHFGALADEEGFQRGAPVEYAVATIQQQFPGGMMGTLRRAAQAGRHGGPAAGGARGGDPRPLRDGLADHGNALLAAGRDPGAPQRRAGRALRDDPGREPDVPGGLVRQAARASSTRTSSTAPPRPSAAARSWPRTARRSRRSRISASSTANDSPTRSCCSAT